jgi:hypothetical protein
MGVVFSSDIDSTGSVDKLKFLEMVAFGGCDQSICLSSIKVVILDNNVTLCRVALCNNVFDDFIDFLID